MQLRVQKLISYLFFISLASAGTASATNTGIAPLAKPFANTESLLEQDLAKIAAIKKLTEQGTPPNPNNSVLNLDMSRIDRAAYKSFFFNEIFTPRTEASNCSTIDNRKHPLEQVRDQAGINWCFAFVLSDLLGYKMGEKFSALDIALQYYALPQSKEAVIKNLGKNPTSKSELSTGEINRAFIATINAKGACPENAMPSDDFKIDGAKLDIIYLLKLLETQKLQNTGDSIDPHETCSHVHAAETLFPTLDLHSILGSYLGSSYETYIDWLQHLSCNSQRKEIPSTMKFRSRYIDSARKYLPLAVKDIDRQLNNQNIVAINYHPKFMYSNSHIEYLKSKRKAKNQDPEKWEDDEMLHASTIVARRFHNNRCEYLIRNSWGPSCDPYNAAKVECKQSDKTMDSAGVKILDGGNIWVSESDLMPQVLEINYLE